ncbi:MAG TPA: ribosomal protein S18-alanine N-acetyltransferase [Marinobacter sp.]
MSDPVCAHVIRPLEVADLPEVLDIEHQGYSHPWTEGVFRDCFRDDYRLSVLEASGYIAGYTVVAYLFDEAHLLNVCVRPSDRGRGVGRQLLRHVMIEAARDNMQKLILEVRQSNTSAIALYQSEGFVLIGERPGYYPAAEGRETASVMERILV